MMEYSESIISGPKVTMKACSQCGCSDYYSTGIIRYGYYIMEFLPFVPVSRDIYLNCSYCNAKIPSDSLSNDSVKEIKKQVFSLWHFAARCLGLGILIAGLLYWFGLNAAKTETELSYVSAPKINDFYFINNTKYTTERRPHERYRLAKVIDITGDIVTLAFGNYFYGRKSFVENNLKMGRTSHFDYFSRTRHDFSLQELKVMYQSGVIFQIERPLGHMLYGQIVSKPRYLPKADLLVPGSLENRKGLAYLDTPSVENHIEIGFNYLLSSAEKGNKYGQFNLADFYIKRRGKGDAVEALYWYKKAAIQDMQAAIDKYITLCKRREDCQVSDFYRLLDEEGVNFKFE